jgi:hypothetical protein
MTDWIDRLEERVGVRPKVSPQQKAEVTELSATAVSIAQQMVTMFPDAPDSLRQAAEAVLDGHNELMALLEREDREAREQQMRERSTDVPHD